MITKQIKSHSAYPSWLQCGPGIDVFQNSRWKSWIPPISPVWVAVCKTAQLSSLPWLHCVKWENALSVCSRRCKEDRNALASPGYCNSRTGRRASGDRRFIQEDARIVTYFRSYRLVSISDGTSWMHCHLHLWTSNCIKWTIPLQLLS